MAVRSYQELLAWQRAMDMAAAIYESTRGFPREQLYGLTNQVRRAAVSVPSKIAEGQGRGMGAEFKRFLRISQGSLQEVETQVLLAERFGYLSRQAVDTRLELTAEVGRLNRGLHASIRC